MEPETHKEENKGKIYTRLLVLLEMDEGEEFDQDEQAFMLGLLEENGLITHDLKLTQAGIKEYEKMIAELEEETDEDE